MDIYAGWLPEHAYYAFHLVAWLGGVTALQWLGFPRLLWANRSAVFLPALIVGSYLIATDVVAVHFGVWRFDADLILWGAVDPLARPVLAFCLKPFGVPIEEWAFFYLTGLLVAQSFVLFLPTRLRRASPRARSS